MSDVYKPKGRETGEGLNPPKTKSNVIEIVRKTFAKYVADEIFKKCCEGNPDKNKKIVGIYRGEQNG